MKRQLLLAVFLCGSFTALPQAVYQDLTNAGIYDFLDELANLGVIELTSVVKPYSRSFIAGKLQEASTTDKNLNKRQARELNFYLREYNLELKPDLSYLKRKKGLFKNNRNVAFPLNPFALIYKDSLLAFSIRPVYGITGYLLPGNKDNVYHRWGGGELFGTVGKHVGFYASLRDHHQSMPLVKEGFITAEEGAAWKESTKGIDFSEMRGGVSFAWNKGSVLLAKDHFQWGDHYHGSNIFSGRTPSFPFIWISLKPVRWFGFQFVNARLVSEVIDKSLAYTVSNGPRDYYFNKYMSAALLTFTPIRHLDVSVGNSVISCSKKYNPAYLSPFLFYLNETSQGDSSQKANYGKNNQLFFNVSSRQIRRFHFYASLFIDDIGTNRYDDTTYTSISWKAGFRISDLLNQNMTLTAEYTRNSPKTYTSPVPTLSFESNRYSLGSYLLDNSHEIYASLGYRPVRGLMFLASYNRAEHGSRYDTKTLRSVTWTCEAMKLDVSYEFISNAYLTIGYQYLNITGDETLSPAVFIGHQNILSGGVNIGF